MAQSNLGETDRAPRNIMAAIRRKDEIERKTLGEVQRPSQQNINAGSSKAEGGAREIKQKPRVVRLSEKNIYRKKEGD